MPKEWTTLPVWSADAKAKVHMMDPAWFVAALPDDVEVTGTGVVYHGQSEEEAIEAFRESPAYWLREKVARGMGKTFDLPIKTAALCGLYVVDVELPDGEPCDELEEDCDSEDEMIEHPLSVKLVYRGPFDNEDDAFEWRDVNAPDCVVCFFPSE
jgi:hypothetical protein